MTIDEISEDLQSQFGKLRNQTEDNIRYVLTLVADNSPNCTVTMIFSGNHDVLSRLAFGEQNVDFILQKSNAHITRQKGIEDWAKDTYDFVCRRYGAENIIGFDVHLDETTAHAHVQMIPVAKGKEAWSHRFCLQEKRIIRMLLSQPKNGRNFQKKNVIISL